MQTLTSEKPQTFQQRLLAHELTRHKQRLAEIKKQEPKLRLFEPIAIALAERGLEVALGWSISDYPHDALRITRGSLTGYDQKLYDALVEMGFKEVSRRGNYYVSVHLKMGRLTLALTIEEVPVKSADVCTPATQEVAHAA
ncbi:MAG: hypothetical protein P4L87_01770 [Formivibrio sp.]|nr:hypothetical protein [Formivibrio sp.]